MKQKVGQVSPGGYITCNSGREREKFESLAASHQDRLEWIPVLGRLVAVLQGPTTLGIRNDPNVELQLDHDLHGESLQYAFIPGIPSG